MSLTINVSLLSCHRLGEITMDNNKASQTTHVESRLFFPLQLDRKVNVNQCSIKLQRVSRVRLTPLRWSTKHNHRMHSMDLNTDKNGQASFPGDSRTCHCQALGHKQIDDFDRRREERTVTRIDITEVREQRLLLSFTSQLSEIISSRMNETHWSGWTMAKDSPLRGQPTAHLDSQLSSHSFEHTPQRSSKQFGGNRFASSAETIPEKEISAQLTVGISNGRKRLNKRLLNRGTLHSSHCFTRPRPRWTRRKSRRKSSQRLAEHWPDHSDERHSRQMTCNSTSRSFSSSSQEID